MEQEVIDRKEKICPKCSYRWIPRVDKPKECPRCKYRLDYS